MAGRKVVRALAQELESLRQAGVTHVPKVKFAVKLTAATARPSPATPPAKPPVTPRAKPPAGPMGPAPGARRPAPAAATPMVAQAPASVPGASDDLSARIDALEKVAKKVRHCRLCTELAAGRTQTVFGVGSPLTRLVFLGEAPGADEDRQGEPFVGEAGQLLNKIIGACGWKREEVYILNILKCRPPGNRTPSPAEASNCRPFLDAQLRILRPQFICCLGATASTNLLGIRAPIGQFRGHVYEYEGAKVICTYHPAYLLRYPPAKAEVWADMKFLMKEMGVTPPSTKK